MSLEMLVVAILAFLCGWYAAQLHERKEIIAAIFLKREPDGDGGLDDLTRLREFRSRR